MKKKYIFIILLAVLAAAYIGILRTHTVTLGDERITKSQQIQPVFGTVKVRSRHDTDVVFTDIETGETYVIDYITPGMKKKIKLRRNRWYTVSSAGGLTLSPVNVRIE